MDSQGNTIAVSGSLRQALFVLAAPALLMQVVQTAGWLGEAYFVSQWGRNATAAIGLVGEIIWVLSSLTMVVTVSATTLVAQRWGAGDAAGANAFYRAALQQAFFFGSLALLFWFFQDWIWRGMGADPSVRKVATIYLLTALLTFPLMNLAMSFGAVARGIGDMRTPLFVTSVATGIHLLTNATLTPLWGIIGASFALVVSRLVAVGLFALRFRNHPIQRSPNHEPVWDGGYHRELLRLGVPAGAQNLFWSLASAVFFSLLARMENGTAALAAFTVGLRVETTAFMIPMAFAMATQTLVGQNVGARQWHRAWWATWHATLWCLAVMLPVCFFLFFGAGWLATLFSKDPATQYHIAYYLRVAALAEPFWAIGMTTGAALQGAGDTRTPALIAILVQWLFCLPLTYTLCLIKGYGAVAAWWLVGASGFLTGLVTTVAFLRLWQRQLAQKDKLAAKEATPCCCEAS